MQRQGTQQGFSIIELMIAILLAMLLMGASIQFILSNKETYELNDEISRIQENGRVALDIIAADLKYAGHPYSSIARGENTRGNLKRILYPSPPVLPDCADDSGNPMPCGSDGGGTISDVLSITYYMPTSVTTDCTGTQVPEDTQLVNVYTIQDPENDDINSLYCQGYSITTNTFTSAAVPLVDGIDNMQVLYRITRDTDNTHSYRSFDRLTPSDFDDITAIRVGLLVSNGNAEGGGDSRDRQYQVLDSATITFNDDNRPRRIYSTTVFANNFFAGEN